MADVQHTSPPGEKDVDEEATRAPQAQAVTGKPWMYKQINLGFARIHYASPLAQLLLVSFVCFLCPGMFNAINGLGGSGQLDTHVGDVANTALYSCFAVVGFFAGSVANRIGLRWTLFIGGFGYTVYVASLLCYNHTKNVGFVGFAGALLGVCAGLLWCAQGAVMMSYPKEEEKGKYVAMFWIIFNLGGVIGSLVPLFENMHSEAGTVSDGTYIAFIVLMFCGFVMAFGLVESKYVRRNDGSHPIVMKNPSWQSEIIGLYEVLKTDFYIVLLFPLFISSNWFYTYQFNGINHAKFNIRTRGLNNCLYWLMQMVGALVMGSFMDLRRFRRTTRARLGFVVMFVLTMAIWGGGWAYQKGYDRDTIPKDAKGMDFKDSGYVGPMFLYMFYGMYDACFQTFVYWTMGALSNNGRKLAHFAAFYKGIQSAGAAITWANDERGLGYVAQFAICWGLIGGSLLVGLPVILFKIKDTVAVEEDLKFSDETVEEVAATAALEERRGNPGAEKET